MDSDRLPESLRRSGILAASAGVLLLLWFLADADRLIVALVEGRILPSASRLLTIHQSLDPEFRSASFYVEHGRPVLVRLALAVVLTGLLFAIGGRAIARTVTAFLSETARALDLALARIVVFGSMAWWWLHNDVELFARLPAALIVPPPGLGWTVGWFPPGAETAGWLSIAFVLLCFLAMLGFRTTWSGWSAVLLGVVVMGIPQFYGKIDHYHHIIWFGALLASSPSGDAWSVDAWSRRRRSPGGPPVVASAAYGFPLRVMMLLIGCFYLFAGLWKAIIGGLGWATDGTMQTILQTQWMRIDWLPAMRVDELGIWTVVGGVAVMIFELGFLAGILVRRTRAWTALAGVTFHLAVLLATGINFWTLLVCYVVFIDTAWFHRGVSGDEKTPRSSAAISRGIRHLAAALVLAAVVSGSLLIDSWPVAVYPTFAGIAEPRAWTVTLEGMTADGQTVSVRPWRSEDLRAAYGNSRVGGLVSQVAWAQEPAHRRMKAEALAGVVAAVEPRLASVVTIKIFRELVAVDPDRWNDPPVRRELIGEWRRSGG
jgi:hypothetical protein